MKALKYLMGKIADNFMSWVIPTIGGLLFVYLTPVWNYIKLSWAWLSAPVQLPMGFVILPVLMIVLVALGLIRSFIIKRRAPMPPAWMSYREDEFEGAVWRWDYDSNGQIEHLIPYCKSCDCILDLRTFGLGNPIEMYCVDCNYSYSAFSMNVSPEYAQSIIIRLIDRNMRRNYNRLKAGE